MSRPSTTEALADALGVTGPEADERAEPWTWFAYGLLATLIVTVVYLGSRPGGHTPIWVFLHGRFVLAMIALGLLAVAVVWSALRRPFLRRGRARAFVCLVLVVGVAPYPMPYPSSHEGRPSSVRFRLPVDGEWKVFWGGETKETNRLAAYEHDRRWGLHLVRVGPDGSPLRDGVEGTPRAADFRAWGEPVVAPASGTVVRVRDGIPDRSPGPSDPDVPAWGNVVVIEVADDEFVFVSHLLEGSIRVAEGDAVQAGDALGRAGFSGRSPWTPEPHVSVHLQDDPEDGWGEAIPWYFYGYRADGRDVERGVPVGGSRGQLVTHRSE